MENTIPLNSNPTTEQEYAQAIDEMLAEMKRMKTEMDERQRRIERLRADTEAVLATLPTTSWRDA